MGEPQRGHAPWLERNYHQVRVRFIICAGADTQRRMHLSRDTIHIDGLELGFKKQVLFERHAVGGEYSAGFDTVGRGELKTIFTPADGGAERVIDARTLTDNMNAVVTYSNPLDNVEDLAHHFYKRCLKAGVTPYVVTKKTVFKWQEGFWTKMHSVFEACPH